MSMITDVSVLEKTVLYSHISRVKNACTCLPRMLNLNNENQSKSSGNAKVAIFKFRTDIDSEI
jgi:hypothetical protein